MKLSLKRPVQKFEEVVIDSAQYRVTLRSIILHGVKLWAVSNCAELDSAQYHTAQNQVPCSIILRGTFPSNLDA